MADNRNIVLSAKDIEVKFRVRDNYLTAIRGVSLDLYEGETFAIVGESGSGKSVFTKTFTGMLESNGAITNGSVMFEGKDLTKLKTDKDWEGIRGAKISTIFQDPMTSLNPTMTIGGQIAEAVRVHAPGLSRAAVRERVLELMRLVGIDRAEERMKLCPHHFSGGMRQRAVMAIALAGSPAILFADEPTTALDVTIQAQILDLLREVQQRLGTATVFVTHDLGVVASMADRVAVMYAGKVVETGTCEDIFYRNAHPYTQALLKSLPSVDMNQTQRLVSIPGTPPDLLNPPKGCGFGARCTHCMKICHEEQPPVFKVGEGHEAACWLLHPDCPSAAERGEPDEQ